MEEAPQGTFKDELEWCIQQLETGLLRLNPTPKQVEDTQRILKVLRSRKAPFVKKCQVMSCVFGDYRLKMSRERQQMEKSAAEAVAVKIQECDSKNSESMAYRKCCSESTQTIGDWFIPSDNSFRFDFFPCETDPDVLNLGLEALQRGEGDSLSSTDRTFPKPKDPERQKDLQNKMLACAIPGNQGSEFTFNFLIPEAESSTLPSNIKDPEMRNTTSHVASLISPYLKSDMTTGSTVPSEIRVSQSLREHTREKGKFGHLETKEKETLAFENKAKNNKAVNVPKKKKKKSSQNKKAVERVEDGEKATVRSTEDSAEDNSPLDEASRLRREVDWCVEQLEFGLQRQKSTPKQVDEALRAIKILRSEKAPLVKKRQIMRGMFGDYRKKMEEEIQKQLKLMQAATKSAWVTEVKDLTQKNRGQVYRKSTWTAQQSRSSAGPSAPRIQPVIPENITPSKLPQHRILASDTPVPEPFVFTPSQEHFRFNFF